MKTLLLLAALLSHPSYRGGNNGGVGHPEPFEVVMAYTQGETVDMPGYGDVYIRDVEIDYLQCALEIHMESEHGEDILETLNYCCMDDVLETLSVDELSLLEELAE
jgi:hypothetical protein